MRVHDGHDGVEAAFRVGAGRDVVGVPLPRPFGGTVVGGEGQPGAYRVTGVVDGEHRRPGGGGEEDPHASGRRGRLTDQRYEGAALRPNAVVDRRRLGGVPFPCDEGVQSLSYPQRRVHQFLVAEDEDAPGTVQSPRDTGRHARQPGLQSRPVRRCEPVPSAVGQPGGPAEVDPYGVRTAATRRRWSGCRMPVVTRGRRCTPRGSPGLLCRTSLACRSGLLCGDEFLAAGQHIIGQAYATRGQCDEIDAGAQFRGELLQMAAVRVGAHIDKGDDHVPLAREACVQRLDGVQDGPAGGELVVDEYQRSVSGQESVVLGEQQMGGGMAVLLLEPTHLRHTRHGAAGGVQIRREGQTVGHRMPQAGGGLGVAQDDGAGGGFLTQQLPHPASQPDARAVDHARSLRHMLAEQVRHEQMGPLRVAPQREPEQFRQLVPAAQRDPEAVRRPILLSRPRVPSPPSYCSYRSPQIRSAHSPSAAPRNRCPRGRPRTPRPAAGSARPRRDAASPRSSCLCTRSAAPHRRPVRAAGCRPRR